MDSDRMRRSLRWTAALTGLVTFSSLAITLLYLPLPVLLIIGASVAGCRPRTAKWLMYIGASVLSACVLPVYAVLLFEPQEHLHLHDAVALLINLGWKASLILLPLFDLMLVLDWIRARRPVHTQVPPLRGSS
jgi:hypothetical protein